MEFIYRRLFYLQDIGADVDIKWAFSKNSTKMKWYHQLPLHFFEPPLHHLSFYDTITYFLPVSTRKQLHAVRRKITLKILVCSYAKMVRSLQRLLTLQELGAVMVMGRKGEEGNNTITEYSSSPCKMNPVQTAIVDLISIM